MRIPADAGLANLLSPQGAAGKRVVPRFAGPRKRLACLGRIAAFAALYVDQQ